MRIEQEEPYKMMLFGRSRNQLEVLAAEFLPFESQLHIIIADADMNLQVLQFDPESTSITFLSSNKSILQPPADIAYIRP